MLKMTAAFAAAPISNLNLHPALGASGTESAPLPLEPAVPVSRALTARQASELLAASPAPDLELAELVLADPYRLDGGGALLVFDDGTGRLYESRGCTWKAGGSRRPC
jgi:hypothetical protein